MDNARRQALHDQLLERREALRQLLIDSAAATQTVELDQSRQGRLSRMDALQGQEMAKATRARREHELARIEGALRRMENDEYGDCFACGEPIPARRLQNDPSVTRCVDCAETD
ncbi:TraR/DksA family transcriptional regulator [Guyparkeria sp.]|uniref:TraR/DksA family transcriptional regulator n=1 Tax=Guyparkeria sp. TaxID=2035736 RepID=UPI0039708028